MIESEFEPRIVGFLCNWCSYAGADLAGVSRIQYPPNLRAIRVMCSGRVDPVIVLEILATGADGVIVMGCHPGDCHYMEGNFQAELKIKMLKQLISKTGLEPERLRLEWVSAGEGGRFAELITDFTRQLKGLGPSPLAGNNPDKKILDEIMAAKAAAGDSRLRYLVGRERTLTTKENVYHDKIEQKEFDHLMAKSIDAEYTRNRIRLLVGEKSMSVVELAKHLDLDSKEVLRHIVVLKQRGLIALEKVEGINPLYTALKYGTEAV